MAAQKQKSKKSKRSSQQQSEEDLLLSLASQSQEDVLVDESEGEADEIDSDSLYNKILLQSEDEESSPKRVQATPSKKRKSKQSTLVSKTPKVSASSSKSAKKATSTRKATEQKKTTEPKKATKSKEAPKRKRVEQKSEEESLKKKKKVEPKTISHSKKTVEGTMKLLVHDGFILPRSSFTRVIKEVFNDIQADSQTEDSKRATAMSKNAAIYLQYVTENELTEIFNIAYSLLILSKRKELKLPTFKYSNVMQKVIRSRGQFLHYYDKKEIGKICKDFGAEHIMEDEKFNIDHIVSNVKPMPKVLANKEREEKKKAKLAYKKSKATKKLNAEKKA